MRNTIVFRQLYATLVLLAALLTFAQEPKPKLTPEEQKLADEAKALSGAAFRAYQAGQHAEAAAKLRRELEIRRKLYPPTKYADGHPTLAGNLNNLGMILDEMGQPESALGYYEQSLEMYRKLYPPSKYPDGHARHVDALNNIGNVLNALHRPDKALGFHRQCLEMGRKLYPPSTHPNGHPNIARSLNGIGGTLREMGQSDQALGFFLQSLEMHRKQFPVARFPDGHPALAAAFGNLGMLLNDMGQPDKALDLCQQSLEMYRAIYPSTKYPTGHPDVAYSLNNLGVLRNQMGRHEKALAFYQQSLEIYRKLYPDGHPVLALTLNNTGSVLQSMGQLDKAIDVLQQGVAMERKLYPPVSFPDGHPDLARSLSNLALAFQMAGQVKKAQESYDASLQMFRRLYSPPRYADGHADLAQCLSNIGLASDARGETEKAFDYLREAVRIQQVLVRRETTTASESAALDFIARMRFGAGHSYYSVASRIPRTEAEVYETLWNEKGTVQRLLTRRHLAAAAARDRSPEVRQAFERLGEVQREIGWLLSNPGSDFAARDKRLIELSDDRDRLTRELAQALPAVKRDAELAALLPRDLLAQLPANTALIDFVRYNYVDTGIPFGSRYQAFILAKGQPIRRIILEKGGTIDEAIARWRNGIESGGGGAPADVLKELLWDKLAPHIPAGTKTLYISPDGDLARLPWAALPVAKDRVLLEDFAVAMIPHGRFLLEQLKYPPKYVGSESAFALGNVEYGPGNWKALPGTAAELKTLRDRAEGRMFVGVSGKEAAATRVRGALPQARYAHLATHGFFDAEALTAEKKREAAAMRNRAPGDDSRIRVATKNPLGFVGLVLANGEVMSGLAIVDLPLENLKLVTLSACETGLGELTGGEGVQGLQRAFHLAGCPNVIASLWNVNDAATAALMTKFYHELWINKREPLAALREAQLTVYRRPELILDLAGERGAPRLKNAVIAKLAPETPGTVVPGSPKRADTKLWAAFVLSGLGK